MQANVASTASAINSTVAENPLVATFEVRSQSPTMSVETTTMVLM